MAARVQRPGAGREVTARTGHLARALIFSSPAFAHFSSIALGSAPLTPMAPMISSPTLIGTPPAKLRKLVSAVILAATVASVLDRAPTSDVGILKVKAVYALRKPV